MAQQRGNDRSGEAGELRVRMLLLESAGDVGLSVAFLGDKFPDVDLLLMFSDGEAGETLPAFVQVRSSSSRTKSGRTKIALSRDGLRRQSDIHAPVFVASVNPDRTVDLYGSIGLSLRVAPTAAVGGGRRLSLKDTATVREMFADVRPYWADHDARRPMTLFDSLESSNG